MLVRVWTSSLALAAALLGFSAIAQAHPDMSSMAGRAESVPHIQKMAQRIGLSAGQQEQLQVLHDKRKMAMQAQREQSKKLQQERSAAWAANTLDAARLESLRLQEVKLFDTTSRERLEHRLAVAKVLTPEQRQKMQSWESGRRAHQGQHKAHGEHQDRD